MEKVITLKMIEDRLDALVPRAKAGNIGGRLEALAILGVAHIFELMDQEANYAWEKRLSPDIHVAIVGGAYAGETGVVDCLDRRTFRELRSGPVRVNVAGRFGTSRISRRFLEERL